MALLQKKSEVTARAAKCPFCGERSVVKVSEFKDELFFKCEHFYMTDSFVNKSQCKGWTFYFKNSGKISGILASVVKGTKEIKFELEG